MPNPHPKVEKLEALLDHFGNLAVESFHYIALFIIGRRRPFEKGPFSKPLPAKTFGVCFHEKAPIYFLQAI